MNTTPWTCEHSEFPHPCERCWQNQVLLERAKLMTLLDRITESASTPRRFKAEYEALKDTFKVSK